MILVIHHYTHRSFFGEMDKRAQEIQLRSQRMTKHEHRFDLNTVFDSFTMFINRHNSI